MRVGGIQNWHTSYNNKWWSCLCDEGNTLKIYEDGCGINGKITLSKKFSLLKDI